MIDLAVASIKERFDQPGYAMYRNLEEVLVNGAAGNDVSDQLTKVTELYSEIDSSLLKVQLSNLSTHFKESSIVATLAVCLRY